VAKALSRDCWSEQIVRSTKGGVENDDGTSTTSSRLLERIAVSIQAITLPQALLCSRSNGERPSRPQVTASSKLTAVDADNSEGSIDPEPSGALTCSSYFY
jgi:hypothetical protein